MYESTKATDHSRATGMHCKHIRKIMRDFEGGKPIPIGAVTVKKLLEASAEKYGRKIWNKGLPDDEEDKGQRDKPWYTGWDAGAERKRSREETDRRMFEQQYQQEKPRKLPFKDAAYYKRLEREEQQAELIAKLKAREEQTRPRSGRPLVKKKPEPELPSPVAPRARPIARLDEEV